MADIRDDGGFQPIRTISPAITYEERARILTAKHAEAHAKYKALPWKAKALEAMQTGETLHRRLDGSFYLYGTFGVTNLPGNPES